MMRANGVVKMRSDLGAAPCLSVVANGLIAVRIGRARANTQNEPKRVRACSRSGSASKCRGRKFQARNTVLVLAKRTDGGPRSTVETQFAPAVGGRFVP